MLFRTESLEGIRAGTVTLALDSLGLEGAWTVRTMEVIGAHDAYYRTHISVVDERLVLGGLRLAAVLNQSLRERPVP